MDPRIDIGQRRARLVLRHHLAGGAASPEEVAESLVALHATDPATVYLSVAARSFLPVAEVERALYEDRTLLRMLGMRRTMFVVPTGLAGLVQAACAGEIAKRQRKLLLQHLATADLETGLDAWLAEVEEGAYAALKARGAAYAEQIAEDEPRLRTRIVMAQGKPYEASMYITNRVLFLLAAQGRIVRGRPAGSWLSTRYSWTTPECWLPDSSAVLSGVFRELPENGPQAPAGGRPPDPAEARAELARRWLHAFGPAPVADLKWWTGWTAAQVKAALTAVAPVEVDLGGSAGIALPGDLEPVTPPEPVAAFLPALDPTPMGWSERSWFLGGPGAPVPGLSDRSGNIGPTVWWDGQVVGVWAQRSTGEVVHRTFGDPGSEARAAVEGCAARMEQWLTGVRVTPKFRTPAEKMLAS